MTTTFRVPISFPRYNSACEGRKDPRWVSNIRWLYGLYHGLLIGEDANAGFDILTNDKDVTSKLCSMNDLIFDCTIDDIFCGLK